MGICCSSEDVGHQRAGQVGAVNANTAEISNDDLLQLQADMNKPPKQSVLLRLAGRELANMDSSSKSDTFCVVYRMKGTNKEKKGMTECI